MSKLTQDEVESRLLKMREDFREELQAVDWSNIFNLLTEWAPKILTILRIFFPVSPGPFAGEKSKKAPEAK